MHTVQIILVIWLILVKVTKINKKAHHIVLRTHMYGAKHSDHQIYILLVPTESLSS